MSISFSKRNILKYSILFFSILFLSVLALFVYTRLSPKEVRVTNITSNSASVSWVTKSKTDGLVYVKEGKNPLLPFVLKNKKASYDDRDVAAAELGAAKKVQAAAEANGTVTAEILSQDIEVKETGNYYTHHVTIKNLDPSKEYSFYVGSGSLLRAAKDELSGESAFRTYELSDDATLPQIDPAYGKVINGESEAYESDALVYVSLKDDSLNAKSTLLSAAVGENGSWYLDLSSARVSDSAELFLAEYSEPSESMVDLIEVITSYGVVSKEVSRSVDSPVADIVVTDPGTNETSSLLGVAYASPCYGQWSISCANGATHCEDRGNIQEGFVQVWGGGARAHWASEACKVAVSTNNCVEPDDPSLCPSSGGVGGGGVAQEVSAPATSTAFEDPDCGDIISKKLVKTTGDLCDAGSYCPLSAASARWPNRGGCDGSGNLGCFGCADGKYRCGEDSSTACGEGTGSGGRGTGASDGVTGVVNPGVGGSTGGGNPPVAVTGILNDSALYYFKEGVCSSVNLGKMCPGHPDLVCAYDVVNKNYPCINPSSDQLDSNYNFNPSEPTQTNLPEGTSEATGGWGGSPCAAEPGKKCDDCRGVVAQHDSKNYLCTNRVANAHGSGAYAWVQLVPQGETCSADGTGLKCACEGSYVDKAIGQICGREFFEVSGRKTISRGDQCCGSNSGCWCDAWGSEEIFNEGEWCKQINTNGCWDLENADVGTVCDKEGHTCEVTNGSVGLTCRGNKRTSCSTTTSLSSGRAVLGATTDRFIFSPSGETVLFDDSGIYCTLVDEEKYCFEVLEKDQETLLYIDINEDGDYDPGVDSNIADIADLELSKESTARTYEISGGFNLVSFDFVDPSEPRMASDLLTTLNEDYSDAFYSIARFDSGKWEVIGNRDGDSYGSQDFQILPGKGYVLKSKRNLIVTLSGKGIVEPVPISLSAGWNLVSVHGTSRAYTAESFIDSVNEQDGITAVNVTRWDSSKAKYDGLQKETGENGVADVYGFDFPINVISGYFLKVEDGGGLWMPEK